MCLARGCGVNIPEIELFKSSGGNKYFLIKRFDREKGKKIYMISVAALLEVDFRAPTLDYSSLIKLTQILTNNEDDVYRMYKRMVFNVLINNQDNHAKNFAFMFDENGNSYRLSPAYDLVRSKTYCNKHMTSINGKSNDITVEDMLEVGAKNKLSLVKCKEIISSLSSIVKNKTSEF